MNNEATQTLTLYVTGMHCKACTVLIEDELKEHPNVRSVKADLGSNRVIVTGLFADISAEVIVCELSGRIQPHGYSLSEQGPERNSVMRELIRAFPIAVVFLALFIMLQKAGLVNLVGGGKLGYGAIFLIGIIASLSTCMAVVGGLLLSMSASFAQSGNATRPQTMFHIGRLVGFFILGGIIGLIGTAFTLNIRLTFILEIVIGLVMLILGINLLGIFNITQKFQFALPASLARNVKSLSEKNAIYTPLLVGIATFFFPCGFTQSMQLYALGAGGFIPGALTMFTFALGTLPVLALVSYSSLSVAKSQYAGVFYKTAGFIVIAFALMNLINSLVVMGLIAPVFTF